MTFLYLSSIKLTSYTAFRPTLERRTITNDKTNQQGQKQHRTAADCFVVAKLYLVGTASEVFGRTKLDRRVRPLGGTAYVNSISQVFSVLFGFHFILFFFPSFLDLIKTGNGDIFCPAADGSVSIKCRLQLRMCRRRGRKETERKLESNFSGNMR